MGQDINRKRPMQHKSTCFPNLLHRNLLWTDCRLLKQHSDSFRCLRQSLQYKCILKDLGQICNQSLQGFPEKKPMPA